QQVHSLDAHPGIFVGQAPDNVTGAIRGAIIDDDDFEFHAQLSKQVADGFFYPRLFIARGNHHRATDPAVLGTKRWRGAGECLERWQLPHPPQMKQGSQAHRQKERCCAAEKECNYHRLIKETETDSHRDATTARAGRLKCRAWALSAT